MTAGDAAAPGRGLARLDRAASVFWFLLGIAVSLYSYSLGVYGARGPDSGFFPLIAGVIMTLAGLALTVSRTDPRLGGEPLPQGRYAAQVILVIVGLAALGLLMQYAGFVVSALVMMPLMLSIIERRSVPFVLVVGWGSALAAWVLFGPVLGTLLPRGPWGF